PISQEGNAVIYGAAGSGKRTFVTSLMYSIMQEHTPREVHMYVLDFGTETLRAFKQAPHVGDVLLSHDSEKTHNLIKMLYEEIETRKKLFADYGGDQRSYIKATNQEMPSIVVIIHNYSAFTETYNNLEEDIGYLTREGLKYGISFILTASSTSAVRYRIMQNFKQIYVLQLNDVSDYSAVLGNVEGTFPSKHKGRGIFKTDRVYEFQTAYIESDQESILEKVREYCAEYADKWQHASARKIPVLPEQVVVHELEEEIKFCGRGAVPIGIEKNSLQVAKVNFEERYINLVWSQSTDT